MNAISEWVWSDCFCHSYPSALAGCRERPFVHFIVESNETAKRPAVRLPVRRHTPTPPNQPRPCRVALGRITPGHANTRHKRMSLPCPMRRRIRTQPTHRHFHPRASHATGNSPFQVERPRRSSHSAPIAGSIHLTQPPPSQRTFPRRHPPTHRRLESQTREIQPLKIQALKIQVPKIQVPRQKDASLPTLARRPSIAGRPALGPPTPSSKKKMVGRGKKLPFSCKHERQPDAVAC